MLKTEEGVHRFLEEGLVALLPDYRDRGDGTCIFTLQQTHESLHSLNWSVELLARYLCLNLALLRRRSGKILGLRHHIPLPLSEGLVLLPVKVRRGEVLGEKTVGYVNLLQIEGVEGSLKAQIETQGEELRYGGDGADCRSTIICKGGIIIHCLNTVATVKEKLRQGELLREEVGFRQRLLATPGALSPGLDGKALLQLLPACDCLLRNIMELLVDSAAAHTKARQEDGATAGAGKE